MKFPATCSLVFAAILFLMNACASRDDVVTESSTAQSTGTVPGEKIPDDGRVVPGTGTNPNASVRW
jgi:hypothetical protein